MKCYDKLIKNLTKLLILSTILGWGIFTIGCEGHENTIQLTEDELSNKLQNQYDKGFQKGKEKGLQKLIKKASPVRTGGDELIICNEYLCLI